MLLISDLSFQPGRLLLAFLVREDSADEFPQLLFIWESFYLALFLEDNFTS